MKSNLLGFVVALQCLFASTFAGTTFTDLITGLPVDAGYSMRAGDFDADGLMDVIMFGPSGISPDVVLYRNTNGVKFAQAPLPAHGMPGSWANAFWSDENGDGLLDFIMTRANELGTASGRIYVQNPDHTFAVRDPQVNGEVAGWMDLDNDGRLDILVSAGTGASATTTVFWKEAGGAYSSTVLPGGRFTLASDLDNDGDADVVSFVPSVSVRSSESMVVRNDGGRRFADSGVRGSYSLAADLNDDGRVDLIGTPNSGTIFPGGANLQTDVDFNEGNLRFRRQLAVGASNNYIAMDAGDYTGDGWADLLYFTSYEASGFFAAVGAEQRRGVCE